LNWDNLLCEGVEEVGTIWWQALFWDMIESLNRQDKKQWEALKTNSSYDL